ncbi:hypothetical protein CJF30_00006596 [Rutstroemia sp. NJR-2017a BBW]|nr:hypothetical protein CJF30_00006596 [Rutstroemia sp. NJR-2017a BBW]
MDAPFTEQEQRFVLAEAIKTSDIPLDRVLVLLTESNVVPNWLHMQIPHDFEGRNVDSCMKAFESLRTRRLSNFQQFSTPHYPTSSSPGLQPKRKSTSELELGPVDSSRKRRASGLDIVTTGQRSLQPKPAPIGSPLSFNTPFPAQAPKKRGRPSKQELKVRQAEEVARGEVLGALESPKGPLDTSGSGDGNLSGLAALAPLLAGSQEPESSPAMPSSEQGDSSRKRRGRPTSSRSSKVPRTGEGSFPILPATFPQQLHTPTPQPIGTQRPYDHPTMPFSRSIFNPQDPMQAHHHNQEAQFNVHTAEIQSRQMHPSGGEQVQAQAQTQVKGQPEMRYEGAAGQEPKSTEHPENPRRSDV